MQKQRRTALKRLLATIGGVLGAGVIARAEKVQSVTTAGHGTTVGHETPSTAGHQAGAAGMTAEEFQQQVPLFSSHVIHNGLVYIAGIGAHVEPFEIKAHTEIVLKGMEKELIAAGSSMEKVLKVSVFLNDIEDYKGMNEVYKGRFGSKPPVRTTVAVAKGGVPGNSLVEMDCIAYV